MPGESKYALEELRAWKESLRKQEEIDEEKEELLREFEVEEAFEKLNPSAESIIQSIVNEFQSTNAYRVSRIVLTNRGAYSCYGFGSYMEDWFQKHLQEILATSVRVRHGYATHGYTIEVTCPKNAKCTDHEAWTPLLILLIMIAVCAMIAAFNPACLHSS